MKYYDFKTKVFGKCILSGEHAVLRGYHAIVIPIKNKFLSVKYKKIKNILTIIYNHTNTYDLNVMKILFIKILKYGISILDKNMHYVFGYFDINTNIDIGTGLGFSAAICVSITRWFIYMNYLSHELEYIFSKKLENIFHCSSSGVDIIGVSSNNMIHFKNSICKPIQSNWKPNLLLSYCGKKSDTYSCIQITRKLWKCNPNKANKIDKYMNNSTLQAIFALKNCSIFRLQLSIQKSYSCFKQWGLINPIMDNHIEHIIKLGALAVKPTGSGNGGYILSLWKNNIYPKQLKYISIF